MKNCKFLLLCIVAMLSLYLKADAQVNADFSINYQFPNCSPTVITFVNNSTGVAPLSYAWDFGVPGITSSLINPSTTYSKCGTYTVKLTVTNGNGQKSTISKQVITNCEPVANFSVAGGQSCAPTTATFTSTSSPGSGSISNYVWDFGDGYSGNGANPSHLYSTPGCKTVTLVVTNTNGCIADTTYKSIVCPATTPVADFSASNSISCYAPLNVNYSPSASGGTPPYTYQWNFTGGAPATATSTNPGINYVNPGFFASQMIVSDAHGCKDTIAKSNFVQIGNNTANFNVSTTSGCAPLHVYFSVPQNTQLLSALWHAPGAVDTTYSNTEFFTTFPNAGTYQVCLTATFPGGCTAQKCTTIVVGSVPVARFTVSGNATTCAPPIKNVVFTNTSTGTGTLKYSWLFPGGTPSSSNLQNPPPVNYNSCGNYGVTLIVSNAQGCSDTMKMDSIININCPVASATVSGKSGCVPYDVTFNSTGSTGKPVKWFWNFGDSGNPNSVQSTLQNPSHTYTTANTAFDVRLIIENALGCRDTVFYKSMIMAGTKPIASFTAAPTKICAGQSVTFTNKSTGTNSFTTYQWDFVGIKPFVVMSRAASPSYPYPDTGLFSVSLVVLNNGCADTFSIPNLVKVNPPIAKITIDKSCTNLNDITLHGESSVGADTYEWNIPGGKPSTSTSPTVAVHYDSVGNYNVTLTVTNKKSGCSNTVSTPIYIRHVTADFSLPTTSGCAPFQACFQNLSNNSNYWYWVITDSNGKQVGNRYTNKEPCVFLYSPGVYSVNLTSQDLNGCQVGITKTNYITVYGLNASFQGGTSDCAPLPVGFKDMSTSPTSIPVSWSWNFGDPLSGSSNYSTLQNPVHTYNYDGAFQIVLAVTDNHGCVSSYTSNSNAVVASKPIVSFVASDSSVCLGNPICFSNSTTSVTGFFTYSWNFGDKTPVSTVPEPCHTYTDTGWYTVKLIAKNWWGCQDSLIKKSYIHVITPIANFTADSVSTSCPPLQVHFKNLSLGSDTSSKWLWNFGDGATSTNKIPFHIYTVAGSFTVSLKMTASNGCTNTITFTNYINITGPVAQVTVTPKMGCAPLTTCFHAVSQKPISYTWNFGGGSVLQAGGADICFDYTKIGIYHPQVILDGGLGCVYSLPLDSIIVATPVAGFKATPTSLCGGGVMAFTDTSHSIVKISNWTWDFGDVSSGGNNSSTTQNPNHTFNSVNSYAVKLSVKDMVGCTATVTDTVQVHPYPKASFTSNTSTICPNGTVLFTNTSTGDSIFSYKWNFSDASSGSSNTSSSKNASHTFVTPGNFPVKLVITTIYGCTDSVINTISVRNYPVANAGPDKSICINASTTLTGTGGLSYTWSPATGLSNTTSSSINASPLSTTTYSLVVTDAVGCSSVDNVVVTVNPLPVVNAGSDKNVCKGLSTTLNASGALNYSWTPSAGLSSSVISSPVATPVVTTTYIVTGRDNNGCINTDAVTVNVLALPIANAGPDASVCKGNSAQLSGSGGIIYSWSPSGTLTGATTSAPVALPVSTTNYVLAVTDTNGCIGKDTAVVTVMPLPPVNAGIDQDICINFSGQLKATGAQNYLWTPSATLNDSTIANPVAQPTITTTYSVIGTGVNGCTAGDAIAVNVHYNPVIDAGADRVICYGLSTQLQATGGATYNWSPINGLNNAGIANPVASPKSTINYIVTGASIWSCLITDSVIVNVLPPPPANAGPDAEICFGASTQLNASGGVSYSWSQGGTLSSPDIFNPIATPQVTTDYIVTVTDTNHCTAKDTVQVIVHPLPNINAGPDRILCEGSPILLGVSGGVKYHWSPPSALSDTSIANPLASPTRDIQYIVVGDDPIGCQGRDTLNIRVMHPFKAEVDANQDVCSGSAIQLHATGGSIYNWAPPAGLDNPLIPNPYASPDVSTNYQVIVSDGMCFADTAYVFVKVNPLPSVYAGQDEMIIAGQKVQLNATGENGTYAWYPSTGLSCTDCANPIASPLQTTSYVVVCTNVNGCFAADTIIVQVGCTDDVMFIPNAFTPNGDGQNDKFFIRSQGLRSLDYIRIYDRWGELVYESTDLTEGWDGNYHNKPVQPGVYVYYTEAICSNGQKIIRQGNITLIR